MHSMHPSTASERTLRAASAAKAPAVAIAVGRDYRLDFFRGLALFLIFIDHIPGNPLAHFTLKSYAFCDAAEVFILISGYTAAMVYGRAMERDGVAMASVRIWRRVWQLYVAHLVVFLVYSAQVAYAMSRITNPLFVESLGIGDFLARPDETLVRVLTLRFQPAYLDILPLYIALLASFPLFLLLLRRSFAMAILVSAALYVVARYAGLNMPGNADAEGWYFNPLTWQFLFMLAAALGYRRGRGAPVGEIPRWLVAGAGAFAAFACVVQLSWVLHGFFPAVPALLRHQLWPLDKTMMDPLRLASVLSLAILVAHFVPRDARWLTGRLAWPVVLCGQNSLDVFCLGILLSVLGGILFTEFGMTLPMVVAVNGGGMAAMLALAYGLAWYGAGGRLPARPEPTPA